MNETTPPSASLRAATEAMMPPRKKKGNPPGYIPPSRRKTKMVGAHMPRAIADAFRKVAREEGMSVQETVRKFVLEKINASVPQERREALFKQEVENLRAKYKLPPVSNNLPNALTKT